MTPLMNVWEQPQNMLQYTHAVRVVTWVLLLFPYVHKRRHCRRVVLNICRPGYKCHTIAATVVLFLFNAVLLSRTVDTHILRRSTTLKNENTTLPTL
jgi:hypothetical protein